MRILQRGDTGTDVKLLQTALIRAGYDPGEVNGVFGSETEKAVKQFQRVLGLKEDGIVGSRTWSFLEPFANDTQQDVLRRGSKGILVTTLQNALKKAGYDPIKYDGLFGTKTLNAVKAFQKAAGIPENGVVDNTTWFAIAPFVQELPMMLRRGSTGIFVQIIQTALKNAGIDPGPIDGIFGLNTFNAVRAFQTANNLTPDGVVGPKTWLAMRPYLTGKFVLYTVQKGDTLSRIARKFNTTVDALLALNPRRDPNKIYVGEVLKIPVVSRMTEEEKKELGIDITTETMPKGESESEPGSEPANGTSSTGCCG